MTYYTKKLIGISYITMIGMNVIIFALLPLIMKVYQLSDRTAQVTESILLFHGIACIIIWPLAFILPGTFRASGDARTCMIISILSMWIFRIGFSYLLGGYFKMGVFGVWIAMVIDWFVRMVFFLIRYFSGKWKKKAIV